MATIDEAKIQSIIDDIQRRTSTVLLRSAEQMARLSANETVALLKRMGYTLSSEEQQKLIDRVVTARMAVYTAQIQRGGSECVERVLTVMQDGNVKATTAVRFIPWLNDKNLKESDTIMRIIKDGTIGGKHPYEIARELDTYFIDTRHNAETAARTEAAKIKSDIRFDTMREQGVRYYKYVTAGDNRVRPEHAQRNGKIYTAEGSPYLGEFNCRCVLVPADRDVKKGATVSDGDAEYLTPEQAGI